MAENKNQQNNKRSGKDSIIRIEQFSGETKIHVKLIADTFTSSILLFETDKCYAFQNCEHIRNRLLGYKRSSLAQVAETPFSSWIVFRDFDNEHRAVFENSNSASIFSDLRQLIYGKNDTIRTVKVADLYKNNTEFSKIPKETSSSTHKHRPAGSKLDRADVVISVAKFNEFKKKRTKVSFPSVHNIDIVLPLESENFHLPSTPEEQGVSELAVSGYLPRNERNERRNLPTTSSVGQQSNTSGYRPYFGARSPTRTRTSPPPRYPAYSDYAKRKESFSNFPHRSPTVTDFVNSGFYFTKQEDLVRCFQCGIGLKDFSAGDDPLLEHVTHSENCAFLKDSLDADIIARIKARNRPLNTPPQDADESRGYRHPEYQTFEARLASFENWPTTHSQTPDQLAEAGLYYTGIDDLVRCFACDGGLRRWDLDDEPWTEHCRWFPTCVYARAVKGEQFIAMIQLMVQYENEATGASGGQSTLGEVQKLTKDSPQVKHILAEHRHAIVNMMGFSEADFIDAVIELKMRGANTSVEDILELIEVIGDRKQKVKETQMVNKEENLLEVNRKLKQFLVCHQCMKNEADALFLPCAHRNTCMECAKHFSTCPTCHRAIKQTVKTYLG